MKRVMIKRIFQGAAVILLAGLLSFLAVSWEKSAKQDIQIGNEVHSFEREKVENLCLVFGETIHFPQRSIYGKLADSNGIQEVQSMKTEAYAYADTVKGDFAEKLDYEGEFPEELVALMEQMLYENLDRQIHTPDYEEMRKEPYFKLLEELGADAYELAPGEIAEYLTNWEPRENDISQFRFETEDGREYFLIVRDSGGSYGLIDIYLEEQTKQGLVSICSFQTQNCGYGKVIEYEGEFYYVFLQYNYNLKNYDGIRIHHLGENAAYDNLLIRYLPESYVWKDISEDTPDAAVSNYIEEIKSEIASDRYLENGQDDYTHIYFGDETKVDDTAFAEEESAYYGADYYSADFMNTGQQIFMYKRDLTPSAYRDVWHIRTNFYLPDEKSGMLMELKDMQIGDDQELPLVQLWFKEIDQKTYTFCLYHICDYNYMLNVSCFHGTEAEQICCHMLSPKRTFVLTEGERFVYF